MPRRWRRGHDRDVGQPARLRLEARPAVPAARPARRASAPAAASDGGDSTPRAGRGPIRASTRSARVSPRAASSSWSAAPAAWCRLRAWPIASSPPAAAMTRNTISPVTSVVPRGAHRRVVVGGRVERLQEAELPTGVVGRRPGPAAGPACGRRRREPAGPSASRTQDVLADQAVGVLAGQRRRTHASGRPRCPPSRARPARCRRPSASASGPSGSPKPVSNWVTSSGVSSLSGIAVADADADLVRAAPRGPAPRRPGRRPAARPSMTTGGEQVVRRRSARRDAEEASPARRRPGR